MGRTYVVDYPTETAQYPDLVLPGGHTDALHSVSNKLRFLNIGFIDAIGSVGLYDVLLSDLRVCIEGRKRGYGLCVLLGSVLFIRCWRNCHFGGDGVVIHDVHNPVNHAKSSVDQVLITVKIYTKLSNP
jgi:hypothetical protein